MKDIFTHSSLCIAFITAFMVIYVVGDNERPVRFQMMADMCRNLKEKFIHTEEEYYGQ